jgi:signal transduction histidine kinase
MEERPEPRAGADESRLVSGLLKTFITITAVIALIGLAAGSPQRAAVSATGCAVYSLLFWLQPRLGAERTGILCTVWYVFLALGAMATGGGIHDITMVLLPAGMVVGALLLPRRHLRTLVAVSVVAVAAIGSVKLILASPQRDPPLDGWLEILICAFLLSISGVVAHQVVRSLQATIRERIRTEEALVAAAAEWNSTFDAIPSALLLLDAQDRMVRINEAARIRLGSKPFRELIGRAPMEINGAPPWNLFAELAARVRRDGWDVTERIREPATDETFSLTFAPARAPGGVVAVVYDLTLLSRLQEEVARMETMATVGSLAAGFAHEVRNPLMGITATLDAMESAVEDTPRARRFLEILRDETSRLTALVQDLLDYGKPARLEISTGPIDGVLTRAAEECAAAAAQRKVEIVLKVASGLPSIPMDTFRIAQVFENLIANAIQHSPGGAQVVVKVVAAPGGDGIRCEVLDSGPGLRAADLAKIFQPFFSRRRGGTGLGLAIVQRLVESHGGRVQLANRPEGGAVARVFLPGRR